MSRLLVALAVSLVVSSCRPNADAVCVPGKAEACACPGGAAGSQECNADGSGFLACACPAGATCQGTSAPVCGAHGVCAEADGGASCACFPGYIGAGCAQCALGAQDNDGNGECKPSCASLTCTAGTCSDTSGVAACVCPAGFAGTTCAQCSAGYQDNDLDGACEPSCSTAALTCAGHGACSDVTGTPGCTCAAGYTGAMCTACATGFQDGDGNGTCEPTCAAAMLDCGAGGSCAVTSGAPTCQCAPGYSGRSCAQCQAGFQDNDTNNSCLAACGATSCGGHGTCSDATGQVRCTCAAGYAGADCTTCDTGTQDHDGDGTCTATCATASLSCGTRALCDDASGVARCQCVGGFAEDAGLADGGINCLFVGGPLDPGFQNTPANAWTRDAGGWTMNPAGAATNVAGDVGFATLAPHLGTQLQLSQTFTLAATSLREGLQATVVVRDNANDFLPLLASLNGTVAEIASGSGVRNFCVGEAGLGPTSTLVISGAPVNSRSLGGSADVDRIAFAPSTNCAAPGELRNGDFEGPTAWLATPGGGIASTASGLVNSSRGGHLQTTAYCQGPSLSTPMSVPTAQSLARPALRFLAASPQSSRVTVKLDGKSVSSISLSPTPATYVVCVPDGFKGRAFNLAFALDSTPGSCSLVESRSADFDDVQLVSEQSCPASATVANGGFEQPLRDGWSMLQSCPNGPCPAGTISTGTSSNPALARAGNGSLLMSLGQRCGGNLVSATVTVPQPSATGGPALRFFYKLPTLDPNSTARVTYDLSGSRTLATTATYSAQIICLEPRMTGRVMTVVFALNAYGLCSETYTPDVLSVDDVEVVPDSLCPL